MHQNLLIGHTQMRNYCIICYSTSNSIHLFNKWIYQIILAYQNHNFWHISRYFSVISICVKINYYLYYHLIETSVYFCGVCNKLVDALGSFLIVWIITFDKSTKMCMIAFIWRNRIWEWYISEYFPSIILKKKISQCRLMISLL